MATICQVNWNSGCGAMNTIFNKISCWINCNQQTSIIIGILFVVMIILYFKVIKK